MQNLVQIHCSTCSVILNVLSTQYMCSLNGVYSDQYTEVVISCMCFPIHYPWLPGYTDVLQTVLITLTMVGFLPDRPSIYTLSLFLCANELNQILDDLYQLQIFAALCSLQHFLQQPRLGSSPSAHQQMSGYKSCGTFTQWNSTQQKDRRNSYRLQQHGWNWRLLFELE